MREEGRGKREEGAHMGAVQTFDKVGQRNDKLGNLQCPPASLNDVHHFVLGSLREQNKICGECVLSGTQW